MTSEPPSWMFTSGNLATLKMFRAKDEAEFISCAPWELSPDRQPDGRASLEKAQAMIAIAVFPGVGFVRTIDGLIRITRSSVETLPMTLVSETIYYGANTAVTLAAMVFAIIITASFAEYRRDKRGVK